MTFPDHPSHEPVSDILAQMLDSAHPSTRRTGVLVPRGNPSSALLSEALRRAHDSGRVVPVGTGTLVMNSPDRAAAAHFALQKGKPEQAVIGQATGAGSGKSADQTAVVQGVTPAGAVVSEGMVRPKEVTGKIEEVDRDGKIARVTSPQAAVGRRMNMLIAERLRK